MSRSPPLQLELPRRENRYYFKRTVQRKAFAQELARQIKLHGDDSGAGLQNLSRGPEGSHALNLIPRWASGKMQPRSKSSFAFLNRLERRYQLPKDHFRSILFPVTPTELAVQSVNPNQRHIVRWHLPKDFDLRSQAQRTEIVKWIEQNLLSGATEYGARQREACKGRFQLGLPAVHNVPPQAIDVGRYRFNVGEIEGPPKLSADSRAVEAPPRLVEELAQLVKFKVTPIAPPRMLRTTGWGEYTAYKQLHYYCRMFGALAASPHSIARGRGVPRSKLTLALLVFPAVWDWLLSWYEGRRGFYTAQERNALVDAKSLIRRDTGWIRQSPELSEHLSPITGLITNRDIRRAKSHWEEVCDAAIAHFTARIRELDRVLQKHRDPFHPILTVLNTNAPLREYRKIPREVLRNLPSDKRYPLAVAQRVRAYLLIRLGMQLGLRRRNFAELLVCQKGERPKSDRYLAERRRGELRWLKQEKAWEVYIPSLAFKNWDSTFFNKNPFRLVLPDTADLYYWIDRYLRRYRPILLDGKSDPNTFFVRTMAAKDESAEFVGDSLGYLWHDTIIRFGIYNPYTKRGAIEGLLPHGPHAVRDVIATHLIKLTLSYELAAYALHCTPKAIEKHYCRFLAEEKTAIAAKVLGKVWEQSRKPQNKNT